MPILEMCVDSLPSALAAEAGGADRIELCSGLAEGGLTPSLGLIRAVRAQVGLRVHVMIRPRPGDFVYSADEIAVMREDILLARQSGAEGVVFGLLTAGGDVDVEATATLVAHARPMEVTFHRAIDVARDLHRALKAVMEAGADRVLTSGGRLSALEGAEELRVMVQEAGAQSGIQPGATLRVMAGGGVRAENIPELARRTGVTEFHAALRSSPSNRVLHAMPQAAAGEFTPLQQGYRALRTEDVRGLREALRAIPASEERRVDERDELLPLKLRSLAR